jgi:diketogulonate reductase-like aldo/keto reductase
MTSDAVTQMGALANDHKLPMLGLGVWQVPMDRSAWTRSAARTALC